MRPQFREEDAVRLAREVYGLTVAAGPLPSERDQNFLLTTPRDGPTNNAAFVLKIARSEERAEVLEMQDKALEWLAARAPSLPVPRLAGPMASVEGHFLRLLTYLPGALFAQANPHTPELLRNLGRFLGRMDAVLAGFSHPAAQNRELDWNPDRYLEMIERYKSAIPDPARRSLVDHFLKQFGLPALRKSVIHNDANDYNVLVGAPVAGERQIAGLVDFGDMIETYTVCEAAVAVAYAMLGKPDPLAAAAQVVAGYHEAYPLTEPELEALLPLACLRLCVSDCFSAHRSATEPENPYLTISEGPAWATLEKLRGIHPRFAHYTLRSVCGLAPCPETAGVAAWLRQNRFVPVVAPGLSKGVVFDLSAGSAEFENPAETADTPAMSAKVFGRMKEAGTEVGIGRYNEARLAYQSDAFLAGAGEHSERRTIHIGLDLFLVPGSAVFAPLAGRVHSFRNNAAKFDYGPTIILEHELPGATPFYTLYGHLSEDSLDGLRPGMPVAKGQEIARIGAPPSNGDWPPHLHFQIISDLLDMSGDFPGVAAASRRDVWLSLSPDPNLILGIPKALLAPEPEKGFDPESLLEARRESLGPNLSLSYRTPLKIVRGYAQHLYDHTGRKFLDMVNNVAHVGHCHPRVVRAGQRQMAVLNTNTRYLHDLIVRYARRLCSTLPEPLRVCFFVNSGSEANELALRLARAHTHHTKGRGVIVVDGAYHGNTAGLVEISPYKFDGPGGEGAPPHVVKVPMPDDYRGLYRRGDLERGEKFAAHVREAAQALAARGIKPAAFLSESLLSVGGQIVLPPGYLAAACRHAREAGALLIVDEVQVGFGRVGTHFWAFETQGVVPDIITMGKPIGNGHPLAAVVCTPQIAASFHMGMEYFNTFGGNPVSCAIGLAVLDVVRDEKIQERALRVGGHLKRGLEQLMSRHAVIGDVRGLGLFLGMELVRDRETLAPAAAEAAYVAERMKDHGILVTTEGPLHNVIKMKPPMVFSESDADHVVAVLDKVLGEDFIRSS